MSIPVNNIPQEKGKAKGLFLLWQRLTKPVAKEIDDARLEYMTKVVLLIISLVTLPFFIIAFFSWVNHIVPLDTVIILAVMLILFVAGWIITDKGYRKIGGLLPCILFFAAGLFGNYVGGIDAPAMLLYALAIVMAAILLGTRVQIIFLILSLLGFFGMGFAHYLGFLPTARSASTMFVNRVSIVFAALTAISLGVWFLKHQYQYSIHQAQTAANTTRALLNTIIDGIVYSDLSGAIVDLNEAALKLYKIQDKQQVLGKNIIKFLSPEDQSLADSIRDKMLENYSSGSITCTGILPNGEKILLEITSALFMDSSGRPTGFASTIRDITQRKLTEDELKKYREHLEELVTERTAKLKEAYDELESFSYSISHDLRSPLRSINGYITLIAEEPKNTLTETSRKYMEQIKDSSRRMGELINDLLGFSRLMRQSITHKKVDPTEIANEVKDELLHGDYQELNCEIEIENMPHCTADPVLLYQVYYNLIDNACKYSHKRKKVQIKVGSTKGENGETVYFISDNGIGFDMQYSDKLFGVFQRLHTDPDYEGTGIGLATVHRIIQRHNGRIWVESKIDEGSTFYFTINSNP